MDVTRPVGSELHRLSLRVVALTAGVCAFAPMQANANPAFARKFNVACSTCHAPVPPRLNNLGIVFKRVGYRMPDADEQGRLILQDKPSRSALEDFSLIGDFRMEAIRGTPTVLALHEVEVMGAFVAGKRLSFATEVAWEDGEIDLEGGEVHLLLGRPDVNFTARLGLINWLIWDKVGHQRVGISRPLLLNSRVPVGPSTDRFPGFRSRDPGRGVELGVNFNRLGSEGGEMRSTFLAVGIYDGISQEGSSVTFSENNDFKDVALQAVHLWGESNTLGALWYRGKATDIGTTGFDDRFDRWSFFGNYRFEVGTDVLAGFTGGRDDTTNPAVGRIDSRSWFFEVNQAIKPNTSAFVRYDFLEENRDLESRDQRGPVVGATHQLFDNLLVTAEYRGIQRGSQKRGREVIIRALIIY